MRRADDIKKLEAELSPTPRVDELEKEYNDRQVKRLRIWKLARQLERELIAAKKEAERGPFLPD